MYQNYKLFLIPWGEIRNSFTSWQSPSLLCLHSIKSIIICYRVIAKLQGRYSTFIILYIPKVRSIPHYSTAEVPNYMQQVISGYISISTVHEAVIFREVLGKNFLLCFLQLENFPPHKNDIFTSRSAILFGNIEKSLKDHNILNFHSPHVLQN